MKSIADVAAAIRDKVASSAKGAWIQGRGWDEGKLTERRVITAKDLDAVVAGQSGRSSRKRRDTTASRTARRFDSPASRRTRATPPAARSIATPTARRPACSRKARWVSSADSFRRARAAETEAGIRDFVKAFNAEGMTGLKDPGISSQTWDLYKKVERDSALNVRVFALWTGGRSVDAREARDRRACGDDETIREYW